MFFGHDQNNKFLKVHTIYYSCSVFKATPYQTYQNRLKLGRRSLFYRASSYKFLVPAGPRQSFKFLYGPPKKLVSDPCIRTLHYSYIWNVLFRVPVLLYYTTKIPSIRCSLLMWKKDKKIRLFYWYTSWLFATMYVRVVYGIQFTPLR